jgi:hypothetical protein
MTVGILSMQKVRNYGSFLQAFALKKVVQEIYPNAKVLFIDIKPGRRLYIRHKSGRILSKLKNGFIRLIHPVSSFAHYRQRIGYLKLIEYRKRYLDIDKETNWDKNFDTVIIGSDEVFNCLQDAVWGFSKMLLGEGINSKNIITYAASCGPTTYQNVENMMLGGEVKHALSNISHFSVRDLNTYNFVEHFTGNKSLIHLDPVFLYDFKDYLPVIKEKPYLLVYAYINRIKNREEIEAIRNFAHKHGLKIISIGGYQKWCRTNLFPGPFAVLAYFKNAEFVITDTFHGTALSIIFNKRFGVFVRDQAVAVNATNSNKIAYLLSKFSLQNRQVKAVNKLESTLEVISDYSNINIQIEDEKQTAYEYLKQYIVG